MSNEISKAVWDALAEPFPASQIKWLPKIVKKKNGDKYINNGQQVAGCMAHIDARSVMDRLDSVVGAGGWSDNTVLTTAGNNVMAVCHLTIGGVTKSDTGPTMNANDENAAKEAVSGALKRAAVKFGIGRHLYDLEVQWLPFDGYKITEKPVRLPGQQPKAVTNGTPPKRNKTREAMGNNAPPIAKKLVMVDTKSAMFKRFQASGQAKWGDEWDEKRAAAIEYVTDGRTKSSTQATTEEIAEALTLLERKKAQ